MDKLIRYDNPAKKYLKRYLMLQVRYASLFREINRKRESLTGTTVALKQDVVSGGGSSDRMASVVAWIADAEQQLADEARQISDALRDLLAAINSVDDETQKTLLTLRYVEGLNWREIAEKLHYEERQTYVIHGRALLVVNEWLKTAQENAVDTVL